MKQLNEINFESSEIEDVSPEEQNEEKVRNSLEDNLRRDGRRLRHSVYKWAIRIVSGVFSIIFVIYFLHLVLPQSWRWLEPEELEQIKNLALSIAVGVTANFASGYFKH